MSVSSIDSNRKFLTISLKSHLKNPCWYPVILGVLTVSPAWEICIDSFYECCFLVLVWFILKAQSLCEGLISSRLPVKPMPLGNRNISVTIFLNWPCRTYSSCDYFSRYVCMAGNRIWSIKAANKAFLFSVTLNLQGSVSTCAHLQSMSQLKRFSELVLWASQPSVGLFMLRPWWSCEYVPVLPSKLLALGVYGKAVFDVKIRLSLILTAEF